MFDGLRNFWFPGLCQKINADIGLSPETRTANAHDPFLDQGGRYKVVLYHIFDSVDMNSVTCFYYWYVIYHLTFTVVPGPMKENEDP